MQPNSSRLIKNPVSKSSLPYWGTTLVRIFWFLLSYVTIRQ
jgi:hypothetical protein